MKFNQEMCNLGKNGLVCETAVRPMDERFVIMKKSWQKIDNNTSRPIITGWYQPDPSLCGHDTSLTHIRCANVGDEIGGFLVSYLSGGHPVEHVGIREMMDVVVVGSVLNYVMSSSNVNTHKMGGRYNVSVWGAGTKPFRTSKDYLRKLPCFDFRAVRGPLTREAFLEIGCETSQVYGDPALLLPYLYDPRSRIKLDPIIDLCVIPHIQDYRMVEKMAW